MSTEQLSQRVWNGSVPLQVNLSPLECRTFDRSLPYLIQCPRLSYLPFLLPKLFGFFSDALVDSEVQPHQGWFSFDGVPLKWHHPVGLLYDLVSGNAPADQKDSGDSSKSGEVHAKSGRAQALPWKLELHFADWPSDHLLPLDSELKTHHDTFMNSVKEADYLRNGTAKTIMSLSKDDSTKLWESVQQHDFHAFRAINNKFLKPPGGEALRHIPLKVYLPTTAVAGNDPAQSRGSLRVVQGVMPPTLSPSNPQTMGSALHSLLPTVFPSRRAYIHAQATLHGAVVPATARLQELMQFAAYCDGFLHVAAVMVNFESP